MLDLKLEAINENDVLYLSVCSWVTLKKPLIKILNLRTYFWTISSRKRFKNVRYIIAAFTHMGLFFNMFLFNDILYMYSQSKCPFFVQDSSRKVVCDAVTLGIPTPTFSSALAFYDGYRYVGQLLLSRGIKSPVNVSSEGRSSEREK